MLCAMRASAQELEPRAYSASPIGTNFLLVGIGRSSGDVVFDPTVPITDVHADIDAATLGAGRTFNLGGHLLLATIALPYVWGDITGKVFEEAASTTRSGLGDARMKVSVNLLGTPALTPAEFAKAPRRTNIGTSLTVAAPAGQYYADKLDQHRDEPLGVQARSGSLSSDRPLDPRPRGRRVAVHGERSVLSGRFDTHAGSAVRGPGARELQRHPARLGRSGRHVVRRRRRSRGWRPAVGQAEQRPPGRHAGAASRHSPVTQARVQHRRVDADRCRFHDRSGRVAVPRGSIGPHPKGLSGGTRLQLTMSHIQSATRRMASSTAAPESVFRKNAAQPAASASARVSGSS